MRWWLEPGIPETVIMESGVISEVKVKGIPAETGGCGRVGEDCRRRGGLGTERSSQKEKCLHKH